MAFTRFADDCLRDNQATAHGSMSSFAVGTRQLTLSQTNQIGQGSVVFR